MVIDTSTLAAILFNEREASAFIAQIASDPVRLLSTASFLETAIVVETRLGEAGGREMDLFLHKASVEIVPVTLEQAEVARQAFRTFGRSRHPAGLNFGDCFAYALSRVSGEPLLFKGADFVETDVRKVVTSSDPAGEA